MLEFIGVNEWGTNFPPEVYDPSDFPLDADYEAIGKEVAVTLLDRITCSCPSYYSSFSSSTEGQMGRER